MHADDDFRFFALWFNQEEVYIGSKDQESFIHQTDGRIVELGSGGELINEVGEFSVIQVDADNAGADGYSLFRIFDTDQVTMTYFEALYDSEFDFKVGVHKALGPYHFPLGLNLLIINRLLILPAFRGKQTGINAMAALIQRFQLGASLVAIKPFPLQYESQFLDKSGRSERERLGLDKFSTDFRSSTARLRRLYRRLGFRKVTKSDFMVRAAGLPFPEQDPP